MPFQPDEPVQLAQIGRNKFRLLKGFRYTHPRGESFDVEPAKVGESDLASVPPILWWFVASYGRHTRAALVHDQLVDEIERHKADRVFRDALEELKIHWVRRWLVWATVSFETSFRTLGRPQDPEKEEGAKIQRAGPWVTVAGFLIVAVHLGGAIAFTVVALAEHWLWQVLAVAALASWFCSWGLRGWGRRGLLFVAGAVLVVPATVLLLVPLLIVWVLEGGPIWLVKLVVWLVEGRPNGEPRPEGPGLAPTRAGGPEQV